MVSLIFLNFERYPSEDFKMIDNKSIKTMQAGLDALWLKQKVHSNNIANSETAGFKAGEVSFKTRLDQAKQQIESIQVKSNRIKD